MMCLSLSLPLVVLLLCPLLLVLIVSGCTKPKQSGQRRRRRSAKDKTQQSELSPSQSSSVKDKPAPPNADSAPDKTPKMTDPAAGSKSTKKSKDSKTTDKKDSGKDKTQEDSSKERSARLRKPRNEVADKDIENTDALPETGNQRKSSFGKTGGSAPSHKKYDVEPQYKDDGGNVEKVDKIKGGAMADKRNADYKTLNDCSELTADDTEKSTK